MADITSSDCNKKEDTCLEFVLQVLNVTRRYNAISFSVIISII